MPIRKEPVILSWSGGKDSVMALWELRKSSEFEVTHLLTVLTADDERISAHGVQRPLVELQAESLGLPIELVMIPKGAPNGVYCERLNKSLESLKGHGFGKVAFGDLFLDDLRDFREENLEQIGMSALFPLWHRDTRELAYEFINAKFKAVITCVDEQCLPADFAGRIFDKGFLNDLPLSVDPCGENGEFHTFVYDGPAFASALPIKSVGQRSDDRFRFCDLASQPAGTRVRARS